MLARLRTGRASIVQGGIMNNEQHEWARAELEKVYPEPDHPVRKAVTALLSVWTRVDDMSDDDQVDAIDAFARLAALMPLDKPVFEGPQRIWAPASQYAAHGVTIARVKLDTIPADARWMLEDRVGEIISLRRGILTIKFTDERAGAPVEFRGTVHDFDVDIAHLVTLPSE
jgi:hypothetical protein